MRGRLSAAPDPCVRGDLAPRAELKSQCVLFLQQLLCSLQQSHLGRRPKFGGFKPGWTHKRMYGSPPVGGVTSFWSVLTSPYGSNKARAPRVLTVAVYPLLLARPAGGRCVCTIVAILAPPGVPPDMRSIRSPGGSLVLTCPNAPDAFIRHPRSPRGGRRLTSRMGTPRYPCEAPWPVGSSTGHRVENLARSVGSCYLGI